MLIFHRDFTGCVGTDLAAWKGLGGRNNDFLLLRTCAELHLFLANTFRLPKREMVLWMHPRSRRWQLLDYVLVRRRNRWDMLVTKAICDTDDRTDHRLIIAKMRFGLQSRRRPLGRQQPGELTNPLWIVSAHRFDFSAQFTQRLEELRAPDENATAETEWRQLRTAVHSTSPDILGCPHRQHQD
ncbi:hypothetical protein SprV_0100396100 [Sparganum proliferum]